MPVELLPTRCAICETEGNSVEIYSARLNLNSFNPKVFSARRMPDRLHYRIVRCKNCGLVRADPAMSQHEMAKLYASSTFDYSGEVPNLKKTYSRYLKKIERRGLRKGSLLEIGCGNGFFLEAALEAGFESVRGVEQSAHAIDAANPSVRPFMVCDSMRPGLFGPEEFDVVCMFHVFDHLPDPAGTLLECRRILKPEGFVLCINHNINALSSCVFGEASPIIDVEHPYLYSPKTMGALFSKCGFEKVDSCPVFNTLSLSYLAQLLPLPAAVKKTVISFFDRSKCGRLNLRLPLGNLCFVARKPVEAQSETSRRQAKLGVFDHDVETLGSYAYTIQSRLSSRLACRRTTDAIVATGKIKNNSIIDIGCGTGFFTYEFWDKGHPGKMTGVDLVSEAIKYADAHKGDREIEFTVEDAHNLSLPADTFDLAILQSVLHHDENPIGMIREALRVAPEILIREPNGNNIGLKVIEKLSRYHREHGEKSYRARKIAKWIERCGGEVIYYKYSGFVPVFCPDWLAKTMKFVEPIVERFDWLASFAAAEIVIVARRKPSPA